MKKVVLLDDIDQTVIDEALGGGTIEFSVDGKDYSIDLGVKNKQAFESALKPYIKVAQELAVASLPRRGRPKGTSTRAASGSGRSKEELANIRDWAQKNGHETSPRGRIAAPILEAYDAAHAPSSGQPAE